MKTSEYQQDNYTIKILHISHRFNGLPNIICSGKQIYQLPCQIGNKSYKLKQLNEKHHLGMVVYLVESKRYSVKRLKELSYKVNENFILSNIKNCPF